VVGAPCRGALVFGPRQLLVGVIELPRPHAEGAIPSIDVLSTWNVGRKWCDANAPSFGGEAGQNLRAQRRAPRRLNFRRAALCARHTAAHGCHAHHDNAGRRALAGTVRERRTAGLSDGSPKGRVCGARLAHLPYRT
jgi:hypothetical protein